MFIKNWLLLRRNRFIVSYEGEHSQDFERALDNHSSTVHCILIIPRICNPITSCFLQTLLEDKERYTAHTHVAITNEASNRDPSFKVQNL